MASRRSASPKLIDGALLRKWPLPMPAPGADKQVRGDVLVVAGSAEIPGAALLAATAALRAGAGRVQVATARSAASGLALALPEARVIGLAQTRAGEISPSGSRSLTAELDACKTLLLGPGMRDERAARALFRLFVGRGCEGRIVLDAAALRLLDRRKVVTGSMGRDIIATPHAAEMAQIWSCERAEVEAAPAPLAREAARTLGVVLVLKGAETVIAAPDGQLFCNVAGNPGLATAGSGDTLAGVIAGLAARGAEPLQAAVWGVWVHAKAGEALARKVGPLGYLAHELSAEVPRLLMATAR